MKWSTLASKATAYEMYCGGNNGWGTTPKIFYQSYGSNLGPMLQQSLTGEIHLLSTTLSDTPHVVKCMSSSGVELDGTKLADYVPGAWGNNVFWIFNNSGESNYYASMKLYYFKAYTDGTLVRDYVPVYRKSDGVIGLYDKVDNRFYTNGGSGSFTKGPDVN